MRKYQVTLSVPDEFIINQIAGRERRPTADEMEEFASLLADELLADYDELIEFVVYQVTNYGDRPTVSYIDVSREEMDAMVERATDKWLR